MKRLELRARQIRALYQRELTALHRGPQPSSRETAARVVHLWQQTREQLAQLQVNAEAMSGPLAEPQRRLFDPPPVPDELNES